MFPLTFLITVAILAQEYRTHRDVQVICQFQGSCNGERTGGYMCCPFAVSLHARLLSKSDCPFTSVQ